MQQNDGKRFEFPRPIHNTLNMRERQELCLPILNKNSLFYNNKHAIGERFKRNEWVSKMADVKGDIQGSIGVPKKRENGFNKAMYITRNDSKIINVTYLNGIGDVRTRKRKNHYIVSNYNTLVQKKRPCTYEDLHCKGEFLSRKQDRRPFNIKNLLVQKKYNQIPSLRFQGNLPMKEQILNSTKAIDDQIGRNFSLPIVKPLERPKSTGDLFDKELFKKEYLDPLKKLLNDNHYIPNQNMPFIYDTVNLNKKEHSDERNFERLITFFSTYYLQEEYLFDLIEKFNIEERLVMLILLNRAPKSVHSNCISTPNMKKYMQNYFIKPEVRTKGYKVTNNKRFIFRRVKGLMMDDLILKLKKRKMTKAQKDKLFISYYFIEQDEYSTLSMKQKEEMEWAINFYRENKLNFIWDFKVFRESFSKYFRVLRQQLQKNYFARKITSLKRYFRSLRDKSFEEIILLKSEAPKLALSHRSIKDYMNDFVISFGRHLK